MSSITEVLMALGSPDPSVRVPAENTVNEAKEVDLSGFILTVLSELRDEAKPAFARNMAGTLLKNAVAPSFRDVAARAALEDRWRALSAPVRQRVKDEVLATLGSPSREVRNVAANIVGSLSRIELPAGEWPTLIEILVNAARSGSEQHQEASLTTLGYVCEEGRDHPEVEAALRPSTSQMLDVIVAGMKSTNESVKYCATNALRNAMEYISENMEQAGQRDVVVQALCETARTCANARTRERAMECLVRVAELYYSTLPQYIADLHAITTTAVTNDEESVALQALQFWISICETERDMKEEGDLSVCLNYAAQGMEFIVSMCLSLLVRQVEGQSEDDWNLSIAGGKLLQSVAEAVGIPVQDRVMQFVNANINSRNWREREAALMAFGCILGVPDTVAQEKMQDTVAQAVRGLLEYVQDTNEMVADTTAWVIAVVCDNYVDVYLRQPDELRKLLNVIGPMIGGPNPSMGRRACQVVHNLALAYEEEEDQQTNELSPYFGDLITVLLHAIDNGATNELQSSAQETLNALVDATAADCAVYLTRLVPELNARLSHQLQILTQQPQSSMEAETMVGLLCGALSALARKLDQNFSEFIDASMKLLIDILQLQVDYVQDEALIAVGSIAYVARSRMRSYLTVIVPYMLRALMAFDEPDSLHHVVGVMGDLSLSCGAELAAYADSIMTTLYSNLINPDVDRDLKCSFLSCISDIVLNVLKGEALLAYLSNLLPVINNMFEASAMIDTSGDPEGEEYVMSLWESTASVYSSVVQSFRDGDLEALTPVLGNILNFALHAASRTNDFPETRMAALMVIGDLAAALRHARPELRQKAKTALLTPAVRQALDTARQGAEEHDVDQVKWIQNQLKHLQNS